MIKPLFADISGIKTRYFEVGDGEPMILVHGGQFGYPSTAMDWGTSLEILGKYFHVYAFDKPGQGASDCPENASDFVIGTTIQHTYNFMKVMGIKKAHLIGHSRGGYTVSRLAMEYPEVASSVIIIDSGTLMPTAPQNWYKQRDRKAQKITDPRKFIRFMKEINSYSFNHITEDWIEDTLKIMGSAQFKKAASMWESLKNQFKIDMEKRIDETQVWIKEGRLTIPTMIIWGYNDPSARFSPAGLDTINLILNNVKHSQAVIVNGSGHYAFREQTKHFVQAVNSFIRSI